MNITAKPRGPPSTIVLTTRPLLNQFIATASDAPSQTLGSAAAAAAAAEDASDNVVWHYYLLLFLGQLKK